MTLPDGLVAALRERIGDAQVVTSGAALEGLSKDFAWLSPILRRDLPTVAADVIVRPESSDQIAPVLDLAYRYGVPVVARGKGTGNYGQAAPLAGGIVLDISRCTAIVDIDSNRARVEPGVTFLQLEEALASSGREACVMPSMAVSTIAGFLSGGNQGIGSIEHGSIWDGWVLEATVATATEGGATVTAVGDELADYLHAYGTTGILTEIIVRTAPRRQRTALFAAFPDLRTATSAGRTLMDLPVPPRAIAVDDREVWQTFPAHDGLAGEVLLRAIVEVGTLEESRRIVDAHGGSVSAVDDAGIGFVQNSIYNHSTLRVQRADPDVCAIQIRGAAIVEHEDEVRAALPETRIHLDGNAPVVHGKGFSGLLFSRWVDDLTLESGMQRLSDLGVRVISPHTWLVGSHGGTDRYLAAAARNDPKGLLNPGKLVRPSTPVPVG